MSARTMVSRMLLFCLAAGALSAQVTIDRLLKADQEPQNWLTYSGTYRGQRHSPLKQITPANAKDLEMKWVFQADSTEKLESSPLVVDGVMYVTQPPNDIVALDAKTGRIFWIYQYRVGARRARLLRPRQSRPRDSRRHAVHGHDRRAPRRDRRQERPADVGHEGRRPKPRATAITHGAAGREGQGHRRHRPAASTASADSSPRTTSTTGKEVWRFNTIPGPGRARARDLGRRLLEARRRLDLGDRLVRSGSQSHVLGHWQSGPGLESAQARPATTCTPARWSRSMPDTGKLKWHFQFTPHDELRLRLGAGAGARRHAWQRHAAQADAAGQSQRLLLRARPHERQVPAGQAVRQSELGQRPRRERPADPDARSGPTPAAR